MDDRKYVDRDDVNKWRFGDRVRVKGDRPTGGKEGTIVGGGFVENVALVKLDKRFRTRQTYHYHTSELEFLDKVK